MAREKRQGQQPRSKASSPLDVFLTAYDPSDLPGFSIDPLGFERGYLFLADKILPGLTNVANRARYFSVLCAGCVLAEVPEDANDRQTIAARREAVLRLERLWALASALAARGESEDTVSGLRGIRYVSTELERLDRTGELHGNRDYKLLSRQAQYGALGMYGASAEAIGLWTRRDFRLLPDSGELLGRAFIDGTAIPSAVRSAVRGDDAAIKLDVLKKWGDLAGPNVAPHPGEQAVLNERLRSDSVRSRMCTLMAHSPAPPETPELVWLRSLAKAAHGQNPDLEDAMRLILHYEHCYQLASLAFQRLLWLTARSSTGRLSSGDRGSDGILKACLSELPRAYGELHRTVETQQTSHIGRAPAQLDDVIGFLQRASGAASPIALADICVERHAEIQSGKFDQGQVKLAWIERDRDDLLLAPTRVTMPPAEPKLPEDVRPHPYRLDAARNLSQAAGGMR